MNEYIKNLLTYLEYPENNEHYLSSYSREFKERNSDNQLPSYSLLSIAACKQKLLSARENFIRDESVKKLLPLSSTQNKFSNNIIQIVYQLFCRCKELLGEPPCTVALLLGSTSCYDCVSHAHLELALLHSEAKGPEEAVRQRTYLMTLIRLLEVCIAGLNESPRINNKNEDEELHLDSPIQFLAKEDLIGTVNEVYENIVMHTGLAGVIQIIENDYFYSMLQPRLVNHSDEGAQLLFRDYQDKMEKFLDSPCDCSSLMPVLKNRFLKIPMIDSISSLPYRHLIALMVWLDSIEKRDPLINENLSLNKNEIRIKTDYYKPLASFCWALKLYHNLDENSPLEILEMCTIKNLLPHGLMLILEAALKEVYRMRTHLHFYYSRQSEAIPENLNTLLFFDEKLELRILEEYLLPTLKQQSTEFFIAILQGKALDWRDVFTPCTTIKPYLKKWQNWSNSWIEYNSLEEAPPLLSALSDDFLLPRGMLISSKFFQAWLTEVKTSFFTKEKSCCRVEGLHNDQSAYYLPQELADSLFDSAGHFQEDVNLSSPQIKVKKVILNEQSFYLKMKSNSTQAQSEWIGQKIAVSHLANLLCEKTVVYGCCLQVTFIMPNGEQKINWIWISQDIKEKAPQTFAKRLDSLDAQHYTELFLLSLLIDPETERSGNFIQREEQLDEKKLLYLSMHCEAPLEKCVVEKWLNIDANQFVLQLKQELESIHYFYQPYQLIRLADFENLFTNVKTQIETIQQLIKQAWYENFSHATLLLKIHPDVEIHYRPKRNKIRTIDDINKFFPRTDQVEEKFQLQLTEDYFREMSFKNKGKQEQIFLLELMQDVSFTELDLSYCEVLTNELLMNWLNKLPNLKHLNLSYCKKNADSLSTLCLVINQSLPELETIILDHNQGLEEFSIKKVLPKLHTLSLKNCYELKSLSVVHTPTLKQVDVDHCKHLRRLELNIDRFQGLEKLLLSAHVEGDKVFAKKGKGEITSFLSALNQEDFVTANWLLSCNYAFIHPDCHFTWDPLLWAVNHDYLPMVQWLLNEKNPSSQEKIEYKKLALLQAAYKGRLSLLQWLIKEGGVSIQEKDNFGNTALLLAACQSHLSLVQWLLKEGGASIQDKDYKGNTALLLAADRGDLPMVQWLLKSGGASIQEKNKLKNTALLQAVLQGHFDLVQWLIKKGGALIQEKNIDCKTALLLAAERGDLPMVQWLLKKGGASIQEKDNDEKTAFLLATERGDLPMVQWLLEKGGACIQDEDKFNKTALLLANSNNHLSMVQFLLQKEGALVSKKGSFGSTALLQAAEEGHLQIVQWLLKEGGASIQEKDNSGNTALLLAAEEGHLQIVQWLLKEGGASIQEKNQCEDTALLRAAHRNDLLMVRWLLKEGGASIDERGCFGDTALLWSAFAGDLHMVQWLLREGGASIDEKEDFGNTALLQATANKKLSMVQFLLKENGASIQQKDN